MPADPHDLIDTERLVERTVELVQLPSVNPFDAELQADMGVARVAEWMHRHLDRLGYRPTTTEVLPGRPNVVGVGPGSAGPLLAFAGHTDTVGIGGYDKPFDARIADPRIHGRGTCDMKGALAAFIEVAEVLGAARVELAGRLMIAGVADEEHAMIGSAALGAAGPIADYAIVGEPTELGICVAHKGQYGFPISTYGTAVHSSIADEGANAIEMMTDIITMLRGYHQELRAGDAHQLCGRASLNMGVIHGGEMVSIVPDWCELHVDRRLLPGETSTEVRRELSRRIGEIADGNPDFRWEIGPPLVDAGPLDTDPESPLVVAAQASMGARGRDSEPVGFSGATDAPNLNAPAIIWGPGSLSQAHTTDEWIDIAELELAAHVYLDTALTLLG